MSGPTHAGGSPEQPSDDGMRAPTTPRDPIDLNTPDLVALQAWLTRNFPELSRKVVEAVIAHRQDGNRLESPEQLSGKQTGIRGIGRATAERIFRLATPALEPLDESLCSYSTSWSPVMPQSTALKLGERCVAALERRLTQVEPNRPVDILIFPTVIPDSIVDPEVLRYILKHSDIPEEQTQELIDAIASGYSPTETEKLLRNRFYPRLEQKSRDFNAANAMRGGLSNEFFSPFLDFVNRISVSRNVGLAWEPMTFDSWRASAQFLLNVERADGFFEAGEIDNAVYALQRGASGLKKSLDARNSSFIELLGHPESYRGEKNALRFLIIGSIRVAQVREITFATESEFRLDHSDRLEIPTIVPPLDNYIAYGAPAPDSGSVARALCLAHFLDRDIHALLHDGKIRTDQLKSLWPIYTGRDLADRNLLEDWATSVTHPNQGQERPDMTLHWLKSNVATFMDLRTLSMPNSSKIWE